MIYLTLKPLLNIFNNITSLSKLIPIKKIYFCTFLHLKHKIKV